MVELVGVINAEKLNYNVPLDDRMLFPVMWMRWHILFQNLRKDVSVDELLDSKRMTWRVLGNLIADLDTKQDKPWNGIDWLILDLKAHEIHKLEVGVSSFSYSWGGRVKGEMVPIPYFIDSNRKIACTIRNGYAEREYNAKMMQFFGPKLPIRLKTTHPYYRTITSKSVPDSDQVGG